MLGQVTGGITVLGQVVYSAGTGDRWYHSAGTGGIQCWDR